MTAEPTQALSIGTVIGGSTPANLPWREAIRGLTTAIATAARGVDVPLGINVVFHVPGNLAAPEFEGVRTGRYSKAMSLLMVQVAVPVAADVDPAGFVRDAVRAAIAEGARWAEKRRVPIDVEQLESILSSA